MAALSKLQLIRDFPHIRECTEFHFSSNKNCFINLTHTFSNSACSCALYYIPISVMQLALIGFKRLDRQKLKNILLGHLRSTLYGATLPTAVTAMICLYTAIFGTFNIYGVIMVVLGVAGPLFIESKRNRQLNAYMLSTIMLEIMSHELHSANIIKRSPLRDTLKFMFVNGAVMYYLKLKKLKSLNFWFYNVEPAIEKGQKNDECSHEETCTQYLKNGFQKYFLIGCTWSAVKILLKKFGEIAKRPKSIPEHLLKMENLKFGAALGSYALIYRCVTCYLRKIDRNANQQREALHSLIAGTLAGSTFMISPNLHFGLTSIITLMQIFYEKLKDTTLSNKFWDKFPGGEISFTVSVAYIIVCCIVNSKAYQRCNARIIFDVFSANTVSSFRRVIHSHMQIPLEK